MRKTKEEAEKTKEMILKGAIKVISEKGYSSTRMEDIAKSANVTRGAIYHYYKNKNAILYDIHSKNKNRIHVLMQKLENSESNPIEIMKNAFIELFERFENDEEFRTIEEVFLKIEFAAIIKEDEELRERFQTDMNESKNRMQKIIKIGQEKGAIRNDISPQNLALTIMSFYVGITTLWFIKFVDFSIKEKAKDYVDVLFNGIKK